MTGEEYKRLEERETARETIYDGAILRLEKMRVELPNGKSAMREIVRHKGAAAVIPVDGMGRAAVVWQYRAAIGRVVMEIPAGKLDSADEPPLDCAVRELREETGLSAAQMTFLGAYYSSIGFCDEKISIYMATGLTPGGDSPDEDEFLSVEWIPLEELYAAAERGDIVDFKTVTAVLIAREKLKKIQ